MGRSLSDSSTDSIPDDFLDPITQEVMVLPMLLPSGMSVDNSTLEEHQKREATWGRAPNDPFTGVRFTSMSRPVPNPQLKSRIDHFLLRNGLTGLNGRLGRRGEGGRPQASRLVASGMDVSTPESSHHNKNTSDSLIIQCDASRTENHPADKASPTSKCRSLLERGDKRHLDAEAEDRWTAANQPAKRQRADAGEYAPRGITNTQHLFCHPRCSMCQSPAAAAALTRSVCQPAWRTHSSLSCAAAPRSPPTCPSRGGLPRTLLTLSQHTAHTAARQQVLDQQVGPPVDTSRCTIF